MQINREGRFKARFVESGVSETGPNNLATFTARFALVEEFLDNEWQDIDAEGAEITGYFYLEKKDNSINTRTIDSLCEATGWDGRDLFWLQDADLTSTVVQLTIGMETYDNKTRPKIKWINHEDSEPSMGVKRAEGAAKTALANRLSSKLRANAGGTPRSAPAPKTSKPPAPKAPAKKPAANAPTASSMDEAWEVWGKAAKWPDDKHCEREWFRVLGEVYPDRELESLTADEWQHFVEVGPKQIVPF